MFTAATPVGIGIMWAEFEANIRKSDPAILCIQGAVCGAIIYMACSDLIAREFQASEDINVNDSREESEKNCQQRIISCFKWFFVVLGCVFLLALFTVGGQDLTDPDKRLQDQVQIDLPKSSN